MCLLKTGACLIQVNLNKFAFFWELKHACLIEVATMTGFTIYGYLSLVKKNSWPVSFFYQGYVHFLCYAPLQNIAMK